MENIVELHIINDGEGGSFVTYRKKFPHYTRSFYSNYESINNILEEVKSDMEYEDRNRLM